MKARTHLLSAPPPLRSSLLLAGSALALAASTHSTRAASATWNVNASGNWVNAANWNTTMAPGVSDGGVTTNNADTATFGTIITGSRTITVDDNRNIFGINFAGNSSAYMLSSGSLLLSRTGTIQTTGAGNSHTDTISAPLVLQGAAGLGGGYTIASNSSTVGRILNITGNISPALTAASLVITGSNTGNNTLAGVISDSTSGGKLALFKTGTGAWVLSGTSTFSGNASVDAGTLNFTSAGALGLGSIFLGDSSNANVSLLNTNSSADVNFARSVVVQSVNLGTVTFGSNTSGTRNHTYSGTITLGTSTSAGHGIILTSGNGFGVMTFSGVIATSSLVANTAGVVTINGGINATLSLSGNNTFTGGVLLSSGRLSLNNSSALGSGTLTVDGGNFNQLVGAFTSSRNNPQTWNSDFSSSGSLTVDLGAGRVNLGATGTATTRVITSTNSGSTGATGLAIRGPISNGTNGTTINLTKAGDGILSLGGVSDYSGDTTVTEGTLRLVDGDNRLPPTTKLFLSGGDFIRGTFDLNGRNQTVAGLFGGSGAARGLVTNTGSSTSALNVTGNSTFDGSIVDGSATSKTALTKSVGGTLTLTSTLDITYSGATNVTGGTLALIGRLTQTSALNVNAGGTLEIGASERIKDNAPFVLNGGTLKTNGFSESLGKLTISGSSFLDLGTGASILNIEPSNTSIWSGSLSIVNWSGSPSGGGIDQINFLSFGSIPLTPTQVTLVTFVDPAGFTGNFPAQLNSQYELVPVVPEPGAASALLAGLGVSLAARRRRGHCECDVTHEPATG